MISAEIVKDSVSPQGKRLTTFKLRYMRFIHAEFLTHRDLSRNASGSRAVPTAKLIEEVRTDHLRAAPVFWGKNQKGMQAAEELDDRTPEGSEHWQQRRSDQDMAKQQWHEAAISAAHYAEQLAAIGAHKQIVNRILEPFSHINVVASATEWENFFGLRLHKDAQPEIRALAEAMWRARSESVPEEILPGEWHLPFASSHHDAAAALKFSEESAEVGHWFGRWAEPQEVLLWVSTARCARVSYESFETGKPSTIEEDVKLFLKLLGSHPVHASPAEHQATPDTVLDDGASFAQWQNPGQHGNFSGWRQHRKMIPGEAVAPLPEGYP